MTSYLEPLLEWLLRSSWQAAVLVLIVLAAQWLFRKRLSARWRYALWLVVIVRLAVPYSPESPVSIFNVASMGSMEAGPIPVWVAHDPATSTPPVEPTAPTDLAPGSPIATSRDFPAAGRHDFFATDPHAPEEALPPAAAPESVPGSWSGERAMWIFVAIWIAGVVVFGARILLQSIRFSRRIRRAAPVADPAARAAFNSGKEALRLSRPIDLLETGAVRSPAVCGIIRPKVLLPSGLSRAFSAEELRCVFLHELAHVKRHDVAVHWLATGLKVLHWFNPLLWYGFRRMAADRELACDELALSHARDNENRPYGATIIKMLERMPRSAAMPGMVGIAESWNQMSRRITMIAAFRKHRRWSATAIVLLGVLSVFGLTDARSVIQAPEEAVVESAEASEKVSGPRELLFRVRDADTGAPLEGVLVEASGEELVTDEEGMCVLEVPDLQSGFYYRVTLSKDGYVARYVSWSAYQRDEPDDIPSEYTAHLERGITIGGVVENEEEEGIPGVRLVFTGPSPSGVPDRERSTMMGDYHTEVTDEDGRWRCDHVPLRFERILYRLEHEEYVTRTFRTEMGARRVGSIEIPAEDLPKQEAVMVLERGERLAGVVVDPDGAPVSGAILTQDRDWRNPAASVTSGEDGRFAFGNAEPGELILTIQADGLAAQTKTVTVSPEMPEMRIEMEPGYVLRGRTVDENGTPLAGVTVRVGRIDFERAHYDWRTTTDDEGRFVWDSAPAEPQVYDISTSGHVPLLGHSLEADGEEKTLVLQSRSPEFGGIHVAGSVTDAETGGPVPEFTVHLTEFQSGTYSTLRRDFSGGRYTLPVSGSYDAYLVEIQADGYFPSSDSRRFVSAGDREIDFELVPSPNFEGRVVLPDGTPVPEAGVAMTTGVNAAEIFGRRLRDLDRSIVVDTDADGRFSFRPRREARRLFAVHEQGVAEVWLHREEPPYEMILQPWGRMEGTVTAGGEPVVDARVYVLLDNFSVEQGARPSGEARTDNEGRFSLEDVPPTALRVMIGAAGTAAPDQYLTVHPGATAELHVALEGATVSGRLQVTRTDREIDLSRDFNTIRLRTPSAPRPYSDEDDPVVLREKLLDYWLSPEGTEVRHSRSSFPVQIDEDGYFTLRHVPPGAYVLAGEIRETREGGVPVLPRTIGNVRHEVVVPEGAGEIDLDTLDVSLLPGVNGEGNVMDFTIETVDGEPLRLADFRGQYVLLDFWATWCGPCILEKPNIREVHETYADDDRLAVISLSLDDEPAAPRDYTREHGFDWIQGFVGPSAASSVPDEFGVHAIPAIFLIGPEGEILARDLRGEGIREEVTQALAHD